MTLSDSISAISSPGSADGRLRCVAQDGLTAARHGQHHAPASLSARQAKGLGLLTSGTYGPPHIGLLANAVLSWSLASSLEALTRTTGSTLYKLTWKGWAMPSGRLRFRLRVSARRTGAIVLTGWPTPTANAWKHPSNAGRQGSPNLQTVAALSGWPTPTATDGKGGYQGGRIRNGKLSTDRLDVTAQLAGWPTPTTSNDRSPCPQEAMRTYRDNGTKNSEAVAGCGGAVQPGLVNGFWRDADWLCGRDGKWRPVRPGSFPLANGVPGRVGRLRAYGNAINIEAATAFIKAYMAAVDYV